MWDSNNGYAEVHYTTFSVGASGTNYQLTIGGFDSPNPYGLQDELVASNGAPFSTSDIDNTGGSCATKTNMFLDAPWWYPTTGCPTVSLFSKNENTDFADLHAGIHWNSFGGLRQSYKEVRMAIRPTNWDSVKSTGFSSATVDAVLVPYNEDTFQAQYK